MFLSKNLKQLRIEKGLTQEELALALNVTGQAVSKWERNECYPDITLLPGLANCFGVTVDELLGMQEISNTESLNQAFSQMHKLGNQGRYHEAAKLLEEKLRIFPNNPGLLSCLGAMLALAGDTTGRAQRLCEQALTESQSYKSRATIYASLCFLYQKNGAAHKACKLAQELPHARESREFLLPNFLPKPERDMYLRENLPGILTAIVSLIEGDMAMGDDALRSILLGTYGAPLDPGEAMKKIAGFMAGEDYLVG